MDVDIVHKQSPENIAKLLTILEAIDASHRRLDDKVIGPVERDISGTGRTLFTTCLGPLDALAFIENGKAYKDLLEHTVEIGFRGHTVYVLDFTMPVELKRSSTDAGERQRLSVLEETLRQ